MLRLAVTTRAETYERMAEGLAERSITVEHVPTAERTLTPGTDLGEFDVGFVFPPRLAEGGVADALLGVPWVNGREEVLRSRHKGETLARLSQAGVPTPETVIVSNPVEEATLRETFRQFDPPVVVKPNATTRGVGVAKAGDLDSFLGVCDYLDLVHDYRATGDRSFLVQEYIEGARDYRAMVVDGTCVGAVERRHPDHVSEPAVDSDGSSQARWKHNVHRGAAASAIELSDDLREVTEAAATALDIPWLGVDLLVTDDRAVVNETNARPTIDVAEKYETGFWDDLASLVRDQV